MRKLVIASLALVVFSSEVFAQDPAKSPATNGASARGLLSLDQAGDSLVIARTLPGLASAVAVEIDAAAMPEVVGTIAGEDTIFVAVRDAKAQRLTIKRIWELFDEHG